MTTPTPSMMATTTLPTIRGMKGDLDSSSRPPGIPDVNAVIRRRRL